MNPKYLIYGVFALLILGAVIWYMQSSAPASITTFEECASAGFPVMESYPPQCRTDDGTVFTQNIASPGEDSNLINVTSPQPGQVVTSPLRITGEARGTWFFEASFPIHLFDTSGAIVGTAIAQPQGDWMTTDFVPFQAALAIPPGIKGAATLVLEKANPSGLPENDSSVRIPIVVSPLTTNETTTVKVFFNNSSLVPSGQDDCQTVFPVERTVPRTSVIGRAALEQLLAGPTAAEKQQGYITSLNPDITIQKLTIQDGVARVDFSEELDRAVGGSCRVTAIRSQIVQTLEQFPTVRDVVISVNGRTEDILQP
ncbi:MAG: GerMN domain-containing protein [Candidatus Andersenbacteria bacterium]